MAESRKRERSANFSSREVAILISCVDESKHVIECKKTDATTWKQKNTAWEKVAETFNSSFSEGYRSNKALKSKYEDIKKTIKKKLANNRVETFKTGGGEAKMQSLTDVEEGVLSMLPSTIEGNPSVWDSDQQLDMSHEENTRLPCEETNEHEQIDINSQYEALDLEWLANNEEEATPSVALDDESRPVRKKRKIAATGVPLLRTAITPELCVKNTQRKNHTQVSRDDILNEKTKDMKELHDMRMKILQKEYEIKENQLYAELEIREKQLKAAKIETEIKELKKKKLEAELKKLLKDDL